MENCDSVTIIIIIIIKVNCRAPVDSICGIFIFLF